MHAARGPLFALMLVAGCASQMSWVKPGSTTTQMHLDTAECEDTAEQRYSDRDVGMRIYGDQRDYEREQRLRTENQRLRDQFREACMTDKGYSLQSVGTGK